VAGKACINDEDGVREIELPEPATYKGKVGGEPNSTVMFTITPDWVSGTVSCDKGYYRIEPLNGWCKKAEAGANVTHYTYNTADTEFEIYLGDDVKLVPEDDSISDISTIEPSNISVSSIENFEKPPKASRYAPKVYNEWDRKRGKSKYYIEQQDNKAKVEVPSNFMVYSIEQGDTATVKKPSNFMVYAKKYDTPQWGYYIKYKEDFYSIWLMIA